MYYNGTPDSDHSARDRKEKKFRGILLYDLSAAYDVLPPDIFLEKAKVIGVRDKALAWLTSYLMNRSQVVQINLEISSPRTLTTGTPQGGSCSCLIFALFVGDAQLWLKDGLITSYADDTMVLVEANTLDELRVRLRDEGEKLLRFFASNRLVANPSKTGLLVFRPRAPNQSEADTSIELVGETISESAEQKILGVIIGNDLKWTGHFDKVKHECHYRLSTLHRLRYYLNGRQLKTIADGIIISRLRYCLPVWGAEIVRFSDSDPLSSGSHDLQVILNDTMRIITGNRRRDHVKISDMLTSTGMLSVNQMAAYSILMDTWKARAFKVPYLSDLLRETQPRGDRVLRSDSANLLQASVAEPFTTCAQRLWNSSSVVFRMTNLLSVAKAEARKTAMLLPI